MSLTQSVILGAIQGVTEFLPISSSAHLILVPFFFGFEGGSLTYDVLLHFATLFATLILYGKTFSLLTKEALMAKKKDKIKELLLPKIIFASLPIFAFGYFFHDYIDRIFRTPKVCAFMLISVSILMFIAESKSLKKDRKITYTSAFAIGIAQAIALIPGTSRSGITIATGLLLGIERKKAVDFSFLLSIPAVCAASLYEIKNLHYGSESIFVPFFGMLSATLFGTISLKFLIEYLKRYSLRLFAWYRIFLAILVLMFSEQ